MQRTPPSHMYYNNSSNVPAHYNLKDQYPPFDNYYYNGQFSNRINPICNTFWNAYQAQVQPAAASPYFTITHLNYQPMGYPYANHHASPYKHGALNSYPTDGNVWGYLPNLGKPRAKGYACDDGALLADGAHVKNGMLRVPDAAYEPELTSTWCQGSVDAVAVADADADVDTKPVNLADADQETVTRFIVDSCLKAEAIACRNQYRPCFKNIQNLCSKTRSDVLKPRSTVANIHSQGIPWVTKDFICAFVRLINTWYTLKGYIDERNGNLGKIESALSPEFKCCYSEWEALNKKMIAHLAHVFINLDNGVTVQNAKIYSSFKDSQMAVSTSQSQRDAKVVYASSLAAEEPRRPRPSRAHEASAAPAAKPKPKSSARKPRASNLRGIIRLRDVFDTDDSDSDDAGDGSPAADKHQSAASNAPPPAEPAPEPEPEPEPEPGPGPEKDCFWHAIEKITCLEDRLDDAEASTLHANSCDDANHHVRQLSSPTAIFAHNNKVASESIFMSKKKEFGLSPSSKEKFEQIIRVLLELKLVHCIVAAYNNREIPERYKYISNPIYLFQIRENLNERKYICPEQVVHDFRSVLNEAKALNREKPEWKLEKLIAAFSRELEFQLSEKFPTSDFGDITGESPQFGTLVQAAVFASER